MAKKDGVKLGTLKTRLKTYRLKKPLEGQSVSDLVAALHSKGIASKFEVKEGWDGSGSVPLTLSLNMAPGRTPPAPENWPAKKERLERELCKDVNCKLGQPAPPPPADRIDLIESGFADVFDALEAAEELIDRLTGNNEATAIKGGSAQPVSKCLSHYLTDLPPRLIGIASRIRALRNKAAESLI